MPTVIDSLVVELGLDPKNLVKGQREALDSFRKTRDGAVQGGKEIEAQSRKAGEAIGGIRTSILELASSALGLGGLAAFATQAIHTGAAAGRLSRNINVSVQTISRFQGLAQQFGGSAEGMASSFISISDALEGWKIGDVKPLIADFRALSTAGGTIIDINKGVEATFLDIGKNLRAIHDRDPALGGYWQRRLGLDPGLYDAMIQRGDKFADLLAKIKTLTDAEADAAGKLERRWNNFTGNATRAGQSWILDLIDSSSKFNPLKNGSDEKDLNMIAGWIDKLFGTKLASASAAAPARSISVGTPSSAVSRKLLSPSEVEAAVRAEAARRGINPDVAMAVVKSEGFRDYVGDRGSSFGPFQLHYGGVAGGGMAVSGLGDEFTKKTGLDARDPTTVMEQIRFSLDYAAKNGWSPWHGWRGAQFAGIAPGAVSAAAAASGGGNVSTTSHETNINGPITIHAGQNADGGKIADDFRAAILRRQSYAAQANDGQN